MYTGLKIINLYSRIAVSPALTSFCEILAKPKMCRFEPFTHRQYLPLNTPIYLVDQVSFNKVFNIKNKEEKDLDKENDGEGENPGTDILGLYTREKKFSMDLPVIYICPEKIEKCVKNYEEFFVIFAKVLMHELAHAKLDIDDANQQYGKKDLFFTWMEESMANLIALECFLFYEVYYLDYYSYSYNKQQKSYLEIARDFISKQQSYYRLGGLIFDHCYKEYMDKDDRHFKHFHFFHHHFEEDYRENYFSDQDWWNDKRWERLNSKASDLTKQYKSDWLREARRASGSYGIDSLKNIWRKIEQSIRT